MTVRTAEELEALKTAYRTNTYDAYAAEQVEGGFEPQDFDEAFAAHLEALDAEAPAAATDAGASAGTDGAAAAAAPKPESATARKKREAAERKDAKAAEKAKKDAEPKPVKAPKAKKFRPTSEDRAAIMAAAGKLTKDETPRLKLVGGAPYVDFLKGTDTDADGNLEVVLDVFTAKAIRSDDAKPVGQLKVTVKKGVFSKAVKA